MLEAMSEAHLDAQRCRRCLAMLCLVMMVWLERERLLLLPSVHSGLPATLVTPPGCHVKQLPVNQQNSLQHTSGLGSPRRGQGVAVGELLTPLHPLHLLHLLMSLPHLPVLLPLDQLSLAQVA